jgi:hypothetical protein
MSIWKKFGFAWVTLGFLAVSLVGHWLFGWLAYADEQRTFGQPVSSAWQSTCIHLAYQ